MRADVVGKNQFMSPQPVLKVIVGTFLFHEPRDEIEIRLAILHHVFPVAIGSDQSVLHLKSVGLKDFLQDLRDSLVLKNFEVGAPRGMP
ncbi:hypothetical protein SDC9_140953 [bioreactor metagenome]|uniref:Uncharacterized protein n=1 Tax=bioreactor metagenome TaxID=1076179 RepID=A0A645DWW9_9ZZZZ